jgi:hypothetical protein
MQKMLWFTCGLLIGLTALSVSRASIPPSGTVIDQRLSDIRVPRAGKIDFDASIHELSLEEPRFKEKLPPSEVMSRLEGPMKRISKKRYSH